MLNTIIIDDEINACETISKLIQLSNLPITIRGMAHTVSDAVALINRIKPQLLFLDIQLPTGTGFEILDKIDDKKLQVIFVTAHQEYAIKAFKYSAIDYLLKPISRQDLVLSVEKAVANEKYKNGNKKIEGLLSNTSLQKKSKLIINTVDSYNLIDLNYLLYCTSDGSYTHFFMKDGTKITATKTLKSFSDVLEDFGLFRSYRSHYINLNYVVNFTKGLKPTTTMCNNEVLEISREKKEELFKLLESM